MRIMSIVLGGCLKAPPVDFGITEDTGGHITYALGAGRALAALPGVTAVELVTRLFDDPALGADYARPRDDLGGGLAIVRIDTGDRRYLSKDANVADRPAFTAALIRHIECHGAPDIVHAHFADAAEVALALRERFGVPYVYTAHSLGIDKAACGVVDPGMERRIALETRAIVGADAIVASSRDETERQLMLYAGADPARIHCIAPGARLDDDPAPDLDRARDLVAPFLRHPELPMVLAIARPVEKKNLGGLIDLFAGDPRLRDRANLVVLAGLRDGPDSGEPEQCQVIAGLLARIDAHDLYGRVALPKRHTQADVASLYALAHATGGVFVNPALSEPYGLTLTEAASHGLPVVATDRGGPADIVARLGHGMVANPRDHRAFADAIVALLDDRERWATASRRGTEGARALGWPAYAEAFVRIARSITQAASDVRIAPTELLLCDIDNTLTGCRDGAGELSARLGQRPQLVFGIASGRSLQEATRLLAEWHYPDPTLLVTSVGSEIYWRYGVRLCADRDWQAYITAGWNRAECATVLAACPGLVLQPAVEQRRFKLSYFVADAAVASDADDRLARAGLSAKVIHSHGRFLDILPPRAGKGAAMIWAAARLGLPLARVWAAGDSGNDRDMLEACPNAVLVANYDADVATLVNRANVYVSRRRHAGGVAEALMRDLPPLEAAA
ncbi:MAG: HAD-IIB family hydrolase [Sphingomonas taxi]